MINKFFKRLSMHCRQFTVNLKSTKKEKKMYQLMRDRPKTMTLNQIFFSTKIFEKYNFLVSVLIYYFHYAKTFNKISNQGLFSGFLILLLFYFLVLVCLWIKVNTFISSTQLLIFGNFPSFLWCQGRAGTWPMNLFLPWEEKKKQCNSKTKLNHLSRRWRIFGR